MDGSCRHFFHRISNAYGCGQRKRRRIRKDGHTVCDEHIRWHKTGKSKPVFDDNGALKGWKKILVLYTGSMRGGSKSSKSGWVMHQYHLGADEDEMDGELVVSKIFYQPKQIDKFEMDASALDYDASHKPEPDASVLEYDASDKSQMNVSVLEPDPCAVKIDPRTPKADPPPPHRPSKSPCETEQYTPILLDQGEEDESGTSIYRVKDEAAECPALSQVVMDAYLPVLDESMQPKEAPPETPQQALDDFNLDEFLGLPGLDSTLSYLGTHSALNTETPPQPLDCSNMDAFDGLPNLENTLSYLGAPSALSTLADLHFGSQDSLGGWPDNFSTEF